MKKPTDEQLKSFEWWEANVSPHQNFAMRLDYMDSVRFFVGDSPGKSNWETVAERPKKPVAPSGESSGGSCDYYKVFIEKPTTAKEQYTAECNDVIESLDMTYAEANMFKEIWRTASARTLGKAKEGHTELRGAEKIVFFAARNLIHKGF